MSDRHDPSLTLDFFEEIVFKTRHREGRLLTQPKALWGRGGGLGIKGLCHDDETEAECVLQEMMLERWQVLPGPRRPGVGFAFQCVQYL